MNGNVEKATYNEREQRSVDVLRRAKKDVDAIKEKELTFDERRFELRKIISELNEAINLGQIDVGDRKKTFVSRGESFMKSPTLDEDSALIFIRSLRDLFKQ